MSKRSLSFSFADILATSCVLRYENHNSRGCIGSAAMCVYSKIFTCGTSMPVAHESNYSTFTPDCLLICPQTCALRCLPSRLQWEIKSWILWHWTSKTKCREGDGWHNRRKGSSIQLCPPCTCYTSKTSRPVPPGLESLLFLWSLVAALLIRQATVKRVSRWMDSRSVRTLNAQPLGDRQKWRLALPSIKDSLA